MSVKQLRSFLDAMHRHDLTTVEAHLADDVMMWRPLPKVVAVQNALAPTLGFPALSLVAR